MRSIHTLAAAALLGVAIAGSSAAAEPTDKQKEAAEKLFVEGRAALSRGEHDLACAKFRSSLALVSLASTLANVAQCEEREGRLLEAFAAWQGVLGMLAEGDERLDFARKRAASLDAKIPRLTLALFGELRAEARILVNGASMDRATLGTSLRLPPGEHTIVVGAPGRPEQRLKVTLSEGERKEITILPGPATPPPPPSIAPPPPPPPAPPPDRRLAAGLAIGGVGLASFVMAAITGGILLSKDSRIKELCPNQVCSPEGRGEIQSTTPLLIANTVGWIAGIGGVGAGVGLVAASLVAPKASIKPAPILTPSSLGVGVGGVF
jgi:hypothetical protein